MGTNSSSVEVLQESVARRIAAGEVIERPSSVVRELLDNAIDAGATELALYLEEGGISRIRLVDNGRGMTRRDMELCWLPHATSKIRQVQDLNHIYTLGFRGEALSSMAACSRLEVISCKDNQEDQCHRLLIDGGKLQALEAHRGQGGTVVDVSNLFYSIPARKQFLKRPATESRQCKVSLIEKALPFPELTFRFFTNNNMSLFLPAADPVERVAQCFSTDYQPKMLHLLSKEWPDFKIQIVTATPDIRRRDRKHIQIYANRRRIDEYAFVQAMEYGFDSYLPGGAFPIGFVFIEVKPHLVDFNIHPAKREAKFHIKQKIHHGIVELVKNWLLDQKIHYSSPLLDKKLQDSREKNQQLYFQKAQEQSTISGYSADRPDPSSNYRNIDSASTPVQKPSMQSIYKEKSTWKDDIQTETPRDFRFIGQLFNLFLLVEKDNRLLVIDQHAAHERILYDRFRQNPGAGQELLIPQELELDRSEEDFMLETKEQWESCGFILEQKEKGLWLIHRVPGFAQRLNLNFLEILAGCRGNKTLLEKELYAQASCKAAIKDGDVLDSLSASELIEKTLALPEPRCPHGRPVWFEISRDELFQLLGRDLE